MLYLIIICGSMALITAVNALLLPAPTAAEIGRIALLTLLGTISVIAWDGVLAFVIRRCPLWSKCFAPDSPAFRVSKKERNFYRRIGIQYWKDSIPELGFFTGFSKSEFTSPADPAYLERFLTESHYGVAIHLSNAIFGFCIIFLPWCARPAIAVPIGLVNMILSLLPTAVLRFNTAPLLSIYLRKQRGQSSILAGQINSDHFSP